MYPLTDTHCSLCHTCQLACASSRRDGRRPHAHPRYLWLQRAQACAFWRLRGGHGHHMVMDITWSWTSHGHGHHMVMAITWSWTSHGHGHHKVMTMTMGVHYHLLPTHSLPRAYRMKLNCTSSQSQRRSAVFVAAHPNLTNLYLPTPTLHPQPCPQYLTPRSCHGCCEGSRKIRTCWAPRRSRGPCCAQRCSGASLADTALLVSL